MDFLSSADISFYAIAMTMAGALSVTPVCLSVHLSVRSSVCTSHPTISGSTLKFNSFDQNFRKLGLIV